MIKDFIVIENFEKFCWRAML